MWSIQRKTSPEIVRVVSTVVVTGRGLKPHHLHVDPGAHPAALRQYDTSVTVRWTGLREPNRGSRGPGGLYKPRDAAAGNHQTSASCFRGFGFDTFATVDHCLLLPVPSELGSTGTALST